MATPILTSLIKPTDFDLFLDEIGLEDVVGRDRVALVDKFLQSVEYQLVTLIFRRLTTEKQIELIELMKEADKTENEAPVNVFLLKEIPDVETMVDEAIEKVKADLRVSTASMQESIDAQLALMKLDEQMKKGPAKNEELAPPSPIGVFDPNRPLTRPIPKPIEQLQHSKEPLYGQSPIVSSEEPFPWEEPTATDEGGETNSDVSPADDSTNRSLLASTDQNVGKDQSQLNQVRKDLSQPAQTTGDDPLARPRADNEDSTAIAEELEDAQKSPQKPL